MIVGECWKHEGVGGDLTSESAKKKDSPRMGINDVFGGSGRLRLR